MRTRSHSLVLALAASLAVWGGACVASVHTEDGGEMYALVSDVIPTVIEGAWTAPDSEYTDAWIEFGSGDTVLGTVSATADGGGRFEAVVVGLKSATEYWLQGVVDTPDGQLRSLAATVVTGAVPTWLPDVELVVGDDEDLGARFLLTSLISVPSAVVIIDADGEYVWWYAVSETDPPITRAHLSRDSQSILFLSSYPYSLEDEDSTTRKLARLGLDGSALGTLLLEDIHHDFVELPDGTLGVLRRDSRSVADVQVTADEVFEIHPDLTTSLVWSMWDEPELDISLIDGIEGHSTHGNALDYDAERDAYFVGSRNLHTVFEVDRDTGEAVARYGGDFSDYVLPESEGVLTTHQHQFQVLEDSILLFDNGENGAEQSRVVEYTLDNGHAIPLWEYVTDPPIFCYAMGDVTRTVDDTTLVTWSTAGVIEEVDAAGEMLRRYELDIGAAFGYTTALDSLSDPSD